MGSNSDTYCYDAILKTVIEKYREIFTSLYTINDDTLNEHLLHYLFYKSYVVLKPENNEHHIWSAVGNVWNRYGFVVGGTARYPDQRGGSTHIPFNESDSVVIYASRNKESILQKIEEFVTEIASILYVEQSNLRLSNVKGVIEATTSTGDTMIQVFNEMFRTSKHYIVVKDKERIGKDLNKIDLNVEYISEKYQKSMIFYHNQILEMLGINFVPFEKAERQVTDEVNANNQLTMAISEAYVNRVQKRLNMYNKIYGTSFVISRAEIETGKPEDETVKEDPESEENEE